MLIAATIGQRLAFSIYKVIYKIGGAAMTLLFLFALLGIAASLFGWIEWGLYWQIIKWTLISVIHLVFLSLIFKYGFSRGAKQS
jgi:membrane protein implicated in regulation of membrane protease activity